MQIQENNFDIFDSQIEYWEYLYSENDWNSTKDGLLMIILDCYKEINKRNWLQFEIVEFDKPSIE